MSDLEELGTKSVYAFNIVCEAKVRTLVAMTKKVHPNWSNEMVTDFLKTAIDHAVKMETE